MTNFTIKILAIVLFAFLLLAFTFTHTNGHKTVDVVKSVISYSHEMKSAVFGSKNY